MSDARVMDCIRLQNMVFYTYHGVFAAEKELGQRLEVDVELHRNLITPGTSDDLETTASYTDLYVLVRAIVEEREFSLLEAIAETIAGELLAAHEAKKAVVRVRKPNPPVGGPVDFAEVQIVRHAKDLARARYGML